MYQVYLESTTLNGYVNTIFILILKLTFASDVALNKRTVGPWALFCV